VDEAGKEAAPRRDRLRLALGFLADLFRQTLLVVVGGGASDDAELQQAAEQGARVLPADAERLAEIVDRCLEGIEQVDRNAHPVMLIDALADDIQRTILTAGV
jgi:hypothetical protein